MNCFCLVLFCFGIVATSSSLQSSKPTCDIKFHICEDCLLSSQILDLSASVLNFSYFRRPGIIKHGALNWKLNQWNFDEFEETFPMLSFVANSSSRIFLFENHEEADQTTQSKSFLSSNHHSLYHQPSSPDYDADVFFGDFLDQMSETCLFHTSDYRVFETISQVESDTNWTSLRIKDPLLPRLFSSHPSQSSPSFSLSDLPSPSSQFTLLSPDCLIQPSISEYHLVKVQLQGRGEYTLFPPHVGNNVLYPFPSIHGSAGQTQAPACDLSMEGLESFPRLHSLLDTETNTEEKKNTCLSSSSSSSCSSSFDRLDGIVRVRVEKGDVLYIPPFWFVQYHSLPTSQKEEQQNSHQPNHHHHHHHQEHQPHRSNEDLSFILEIPSLSYEQVSLSQAFYSKLPFGNLGGRKKHSIQTNEKEENEEKDKEEEEEEDLEGEKIIASQVYLVHLLSRLPIPFDYSLNSKFSIFSSTLSTLSSFDSSSSSSSLSVVEFSPYYLTQQLLQTRYTSTLMNEKSLFIQEGLSNFDCYSSSSSPTTTTTTDIEEEREEELEFIRNVIDKLDKEKLIQIAQYVANRTDLNLDYYLHPFAFPETQQTTTTTLLQTHPKKQKEQQQQQQEQEQKEQMQRKYFSEMEEGIRYLWIFNYLEQIGKWAMNGDPNRVYFFLSKCFPMREMLEIVEEVEGPPVIRLEQKED